MSTNHKTTKISSLFIKKPIKDERLLKKNCTKLEPPYLHSQHCLAMVSRVKKGWTRIW